MGKSPGKWIKKVLLGKKSTSESTKNGSAGKKTPFDAKAHSGVVAVNPHSPTDLSPQTTPISGNGIKLERGISANLSSNGALLARKQDGIVEGTAGLKSANNEGLILLEQSATKAQAAFRGYLARRAFRALKGIIRLQALIRGHLVRRQAVATLHCMHAIVRFQAVVRGQQVRLSDVGCEVLRKCRSWEFMDRKRLDLTPINTCPRSEKLSENTYIIKLVGSLPSAKPLGLHYDLVDPNSAWSWLQRWSTSQFWEPLPLPKKILGSKHQKKHSNTRTAERESGRPKRGVHRVTTVNGDGNSLHSSSNFEKSKRAHRKSLSHQTESVQEHPQNELEKAKRGLRKVTALAEEGLTLVKTEVLAEKLPKSVKKCSPVAEASEQGLDPGVAVAEQSVVEPPLKPVAVEEPVETATFEHPTAEVVSVDSGENVVNTDKTTEELSPNDKGNMANEELRSKEDQSIESRKTQRRRSLQGKKEHPENISQNSPTLPSYMAATESAKAKLRAQGSPNLAPEGSEVGFVQPHSLPSLANGKLSSQSPRIQKHVAHENGKGGSRINRSLLVSREGNVLQPGWRR